VRPSHHQKDDIMTIKGSCHCGATHFEVEAAPESVTRCTCSLCSKRGARWAYYKPAEVTVTATADAIYQWKTKTVRHHFCPTCGCTTYSESPDWSTGKPDFDNARIGINAHLFDDFDLDAVPVVTVDGKNLW
jgi:hypothetical protein